MNRLFSPVKIQRTLVAEYLFLNTFLIMVAMMLKGSHPAHGIIIFVRVRVKVRVRLGLG